jgi:hypothetical protein
MYRRYPLMQAGQTFELTNFVVDEWRLINMNVLAIKQRHPETKQMVEIAPSAKAMMKDIITVARESMLRLIALAQGENVETWGFEGESDLEECFTDIRLGEFAINYAKSLRNQSRKDSEDYHYWTAVLAELEWQSTRQTEDGKTLACCMVGKMPARIPNLSHWKRQEVAELPDNILQVEQQEPQPDELIEDLTWNQMILGMSEEQINQLIEQRRSKPQPQAKTPPQSSRQLKILEIIQSATKYPIQFESIRKSRKWENNPPDKDSLLAELKELSQEWIRGDEKSGYYLQD